MLNLTNILTYESGNLVREPEIPNFQLTFDSIELLKNNNGTISRQILHFRDFNYAGTDQLVDLTNTIYVVPVTINGRQGLKIGYDRQDSTHTVWYYTRTDNDPIDNATVFTSTSPIITDTVYITFYNNVTIFGTTLSGLPGAQTN